MRDGEERTRERENRGEVARVDRAVAVGVERRERRAENVIETRERSEPIAGTPPTEPPPMLYLEEI